MPVARVNATGIGLAPTISPFRVEVHQPMGHLFVARRLPQGRPKDASTSS